MSRQSFIKFVVSLQLSLQNAYWAHFSSRHTPHIIYIRLSKSALKTKEIGRDKLQLVTLPNYERLQQISMELLRFTGTFGHSWLKVSTGKPLAKPHKISYILPKTGSRGRINTQLCQHVYMLNRKNILHFLVFTFTEICIHIGMSTDL